ncbi:unnamed protein product [Mesocestoides corti]|uniref:Molybdopterin oxidoreductase n=1 Tax=Mesocestoides corti TaxID=53468 RepID=A0A0R3UHY5_MESCO|nr:unnamed protein product [Mesocestoides corti]
MRPLRLAWLITLLAWSAEIRLAFGGPLNLQLLDQPAVEGVGGEGFVDGNLGRLLALLSAEGAPKLSLNGGEFSRHSHDLLRKLIARPHLVGNMMRYG